MLTSCCPAWSMLAKKTLPDMVETVSSALTPMVATARTIKQRHPEAKIVLSDRVRQRNWKLPAVRYEVMWIL